MDGISNKQQNVETIINKLCNATKIMFISVEKLANALPKDKPDNLAANALQEGLRGQFGEMRTMC